MSIIEEVDQNNAKLDKAAKTLEYKGITVPWDDREEAVRNLREMLEKLEIGWGTVDG